MSLSEAEQVMESIERRGEGFDPGKAKHFVSLAKEFVSRARRYCESRGLPLTTPFIDPTEPLQVILPESLDRRLRDWETGPSLPNPYVRMACRCSIRYLVAREEFPPGEREGADLYAPLIQLLAQGGSFYMHHGDLCIPDVGTLPLVTH